MMDVLVQQLFFAGAEVWLAVMAMVLLVVGAFVGNRATAAISYASVLVLAAAVAFIIGLNGHPRVSLFGGAISTDALANFGRIMVFVTAALAIVLGDRWMKRVGLQKFEYPVLMLLAALGMSVMVSANSLISLYLGIEMQSLALYVLAAFSRDNPKSSEAGLKYFVLGALSSGLLLYGISLIYGFTGQVGFAEIANALPTSSKVGVVFGLVFMLAGLAFKVSAAPFHMWTPDVYEGAPTPVVAFFSSAPKLAAMILTARVLTEGFALATPEWQQVLIVIAVLSMIFGSFGGLVQGNIKRLLAYSSIANMGFALVGLAAGTAAGVQSVLIYMVIYMLTSLGLFAGLLVTARQGRPLESFEDFAGLAKVRPGLALVMTLLLFSAAGIPPLAGFWGKFFVFKAALDAGLVWLAVIGVVLSVIAAFYYLKLIKVMWFDEGDRPVDGIAWDAGLVALAMALFVGPISWFVLPVLEPWALRAAAILF